MNKQVKIRTVIVRKTDSFGTLKVAYYGTDGEVYVDSTSERSYSDLEPGKLAMGQKLEAVNGVVDLSFLND